MLSPTNFTTMSENSVLILVEPIINYGWKFYLQAPLPSLFARHQTTCRTDPKIVEMHPLGLAHARASFVCRIWHGTPPETCILRCHSALVFKRSMGLEKGSRLFWNLSVQTGRTFSLLWRGYSFRILRSYNLWCLHLDVRLIAPRWHLYSRTLTKGIF